MWVQTVGLDNVLAVIDAFGDKVRQAAAGAAQAETELEFEMTQELVPVDTEQLKLSGRVEPVEYLGMEISAAIAYGGPAGSGRNSEDVDYAIVVHEDLEANHPNGGQAKYVETVIRQEMMSGRAAERMAEQIVQRMQRSGAFTSRSGKYLQSGLTGRFQGSRT